MLRLKEILVFILLLITILSCKDDIVTPPEEEEKIQVNILSPENNSSYAKSERIFFESLAISEAGDTLIVYDSLAWESSIDGKLGRYNNFQFLSPGNHKITCNVYKDDLSGSNEIDIAVSNDIIIDTVLINDKWEIYKLADDYATCIKTDQFGRIAVSYINSGLYLNAGGTWEHLTHLDGLKNSSLQAIGFDNQNEMYIGYYGVAGISKFKNPGWTELIMDDFRKDVHTIIFDKDNTLWAATHTGDILKYISNKFTPFNNQPIPFGHPTELLVDKNNNLWGSSEHGGAFMFDGQNWTLFEIGGEYTRAYHIAIDENNYKLICNENGLYYFNDTDTSHFTSENSPVTNNTIFTSMSADKVAGIWIGTTEGLYKFDGINWETYSMENSPILSNRLSNVYVDQNNNVWFSTEDRLVKFKGNN